MTKWNSSLALLGSSARPSESWSPFSTPVRAWKDGIQFNVTIPTLPNTLSWRLTSIADDVIVCEGNFGVTTSNNPIFDIAGYSASTGQQLWIKNYTDIGWGQGGPVNGGLMVFNYAFGEGVFTFYERETMRWHIIDIKTGIERAVTPPLNSVTNNDWSFYDWHPSIRYGKLYTVGYSGSMCCFNLQTGKTEWVFNQINSGVETPYGGWPTYGGMTIADGIVYWGVSQHTPATPMYRGYNLYAINATTGEQIWSLPCFADPNAIATAGSQLITFNGYDNQIYAIGKGRSATTVSAPQTEMTIGSTVLITGTVTDQSPGQTALGVPAAGTPAISDEDMTAWMKYVYQQQPKPTNATGVQVHLTAIDPNGNFQNIGTATSNMAGNYVTSWTPPVPGIYTITATFAGSQRLFLPLRQPQLLRLLQCQTPATQSAQKSTLPSPQPQ
jgi:outer membrane protein assembly factor BamB